MDLAAYVATIGAPGHSLAMRELKPLSGLGPEEHAAFWPAWQRLRPERRAEIARAMVELAEENVDLDFGAALSWCLEDESAAVREQAVEGLWENESPALCRRLLAVLRDDPAAEVRAAAAAGLSRFAYLAEIEELDEEQAAQVLGGLLATVRDEHQPIDVRRRALESAGFFSGDEDVQRQIQRAYESGEQLLKESALVAMGRSMQRRWLPTIGQELASPSPALRYEAARAAGELADEARALAPKIAALAGDDDGEVAAAAIWALGQIGGATARRALQQISKSQDEARSQAAADALAELDVDSGLLGGTWRPKQ
ncbi:MAG TPA: HEAT repeat domain-containing protein [Roseiflexaceae bacterium]|nr:HEAT repeat domain-containing protein [Roseiflexaceae bacterium]